MSMGYRGKTTNLNREVTATQAQSEREAMLGEIPGEIKSFDAAKQTATIQPLYKPLHNGQPIDMPELLDVPVRFPRGGYGALTSPIQPGDRVTLRPMMRSTENYHSGEDYTPSDTRSMSLSDMEAHLDGGEPLTDPIENFDNENAHWRFNKDGSHGIRGSHDGKVAIQGKEGDIYDLLVQVVELLGTEPGLVHREQYEDIGEKLRAMALAG